MTKNILPRPKMIFLFDWKLHKNQYSVIPSWTLNKDQCSPTVLQIWALDSFSIRSYEDLICVFLGPFRRSTADHWIELRLHYILWLFLFPPMWPMIPALVLLHECMDENNHDFWHWTVALWTVHQLTYQIYKPQK